MNIENVKPEDAKELLEIYAPYVTDTAITFEYEIPSEEEFEGRIRSIQKKYPYIKATEDGKILGYAYAACFKDRRAYDWSVETTVYVKEGCKRNGVGRALYEKLEQELKAMGILNMNACIALPKVEDEHLTMDSIHFHKRFGFCDVGVFHDSGYKFDTWYDMIWMEKMIGEHTCNQRPVKFGEYVCI